MDDFLHNLRSGKLKQPDRSNRHFNDPQYKGVPRRNPMDRRNKREFDNKESSERLSAIKEVLDTLAETQKRMAEAYEARTRAEERKARALEVLAKNVYRMINPDARDTDALFALPELHSEVQPDNGEPETAVLEASDSQLDESSPQSYPEIEADSYGSGSEDAASDSNNRKLSSDERKVVYDLVSRMRDDGNSWENIARQISAQGYPTISGKGTWRGVMIKNLFEKMDIEE